MKRQQKPTKWKPLTREEELAAWARLATPTNRDPQHHAPTLSASEIVRARFSWHEVIKQCQAAGIYLPIEAEVIALRGPGGLTASNAAKKVGRSLAWVKSKKLTRAVELWRNGKAISHNEPTDADWLAHAPKIGKESGYDYKACADCARVAVKRESYTSGEWDLLVEEMRQTFKDYTISSEYPKPSDFVEFLRIRPDALTDAKDGGTLAAMLAEIICAARTGVVTEATRLKWGNRTRKNLIAEARRALNQFATWPKASGYQLSDWHAANAVMHFQLWLDALHWIGNATKGQPWPTREALLRSTHGPELAHLNSYELRRIIQSADTLETATRLCEKETGIGKESFLRSWKLMPYLHRALKAHRRGQPATPKNV